MLVLVEIRVLMLMVGLLNLPFQFISYLSSWLLACCLYGIVVRTHSCFCKSWHNG
jgi:hypothetical protein